MVAWQKFAKRSFTEIRRRIAIVNAAFNENISGVRVVQSLNRQERNLEIFDEKNTAHRWSNVIAGRYAAGLLPAVDILTAVAIALALFFGARWVGLDEGELLPGVLVAKYSSCQHHLHVGANRWSYEWRLLWHILVFS